MTASQAAAAAAAQSRAAPADPPAAADDSPCSSDADCAFTRFAPAACCPMLCVPRAVTKSGSEALEAHARSCGLKVECPQPNCMPPRTMTYPACVQNKCVANVRPGDPGRE